MSYNASMSMPCPVMVMVNDEYTNLLQSLLLAAFYSYIPHFPSPSPFSFLHYTLMVNQSSSLFGSSISLYVLQHKLLDVHEGTMVRGDSAPTGSTQIVLEVSIDISILISLVKIIYMTSPPVSLSPSLCSHDHSVSMPCDGDDDDDEYTNLSFFSASCSFDSYTPHFPSPSPSFLISLYIIVISHYICKYYVGTSLYSCISYDPEGLLGSMTAMCVTYWGVSSTLLSTSLLQQ